MSVLHKLGPGNSHSATGGVAVGVVEVSVDKIPASSPGSVTRGWYRLFPPAPGAVYRQDSD